MPASHVTGQCLHLPMIRSRGSLHLAEGIQQDHRDVSLGLVRSHRDVGQDLSGWLRHITGRQTVEGIHQDIVPARVTATEIRDRGFELLVLPSNCLFQHVLHPTMANSFPVGVGTPVKVAPVVPVSLTVR